MHTATPMDSLRAEQALIAQLLDVLQEEQQCLVAAEIDALSELTPRKSALIGEMAVLASQRHRQLGAAGFAAQESGMDAWLAAHGGDAGAALWQQLLDQTREAKELNRLNGMLINRQLGHTQGALQALRPQAAPVYGPNGQTAPRPASRGFVAG
ncbi:flagella synthesis protein FlgN [Massilia endophytica]|uniref:flagella synthesis protein FlgN n=1 Tax=Massilia endophytica TaxID=2899220 RepID=UPI001E2FC57D|nr:flagellar protein FlgN [Massilia endophytica]UGQ45235.1 flagellar protein FlgN [Massilia endophytica]